MTSLTLDHTTSVARPTGTQAAASQRAVPPALPLAVPLPVDLDRVRGLEWDMLERAAGDVLVVEGELGRGSSGVVFLAVDRRSGEPLAVKVLRHELLASEDQRARFRREARIGARFRGAAAHPALLPVHALVERGDVVYLTMPFVHGESLAARVGRVPNLEVTEVHRQLVALADALAHLHGAGVVHRDLKLENVLVEHGTGRVVLIDFGVALERDRGTGWEERGRIFGTPLYVSPEQAIGADDIDGRADLYAFGVLAYRLLAGGFPFEGESWQSLFRQHVHAPAPRLAARCATTARLSAAIAACLAKSPADRPASAEALARLLADRRARRWHLPPRLTGLAAAGAALIGAAEYVRRCLLCG